MNATPAAIPRQAGPGRGDAQAAAGRVDIPDRVVAKVAGQAVRELPHTQRLAGRLGGLVRPGAARVSAHRAGSSVTLRLEVSMAYPAPLAEAADRLRRHVRARVEHITGFAVRQIDIQIVELPGGRTTGTREVER